MNDTSEEMLVSTYTFGASLWNARWLLVACHEAVCTNPHNLSSVPHNRYSHYSNEYCCFFNLLNPILFALTDSLVDAKSKFSEITYR